jgi:thiamine biosynthesis lipoprotein
METVTLARNAMATRFELVLHGDNPVRLRAAGEAALAEVDRLEARLSLYRPTSEIARVNALAAREPVRVSPSVFGLLLHARQLHQESGGRFDISIAPLVRCWGFMGGSGRLPEPAEIREARRSSGMPLISFDDENLSVRFQREGVMIDLGAIGKGYAIDCAAETLREAGVASALMHGGTSTVYGLGAPPDADGWKIAVAPVPGQPPLDATVVLRDNALSVSAVWGKFFHAGGQEFGHVIDPRAGRPVEHAVLAAVVLPSATETDALSTALLVAGLEGHDAIASLRPGMRTLVVGGAKGGFRTKGKGIAHTGLIYEG